MNKEFRNGVAFSIAITAFAIVVIAMVAGDYTPISKPSFEVVDKYKGCDIVRYAPHQAAEYKYFLHCETNEESSSKAKAN